MAYLFFMGTGLLGTGERGQEPESPGRSETPEDSPYPERAGPLGRLFSAWLADGAVHAELFVDVCHGFVGRLCNIRRRDLLAFLPPT